MGTYTTNYNLFMPSVGETGWGTLVNGNFATIDTTMKGLSNRITAVENEVNGNLSCTSVTTSGKITGNGGIVGTTGTFSGAVTAASFNGYVPPQYKVITTTSNTQVFPALIRQISATTSQLNNCVVGTNVIGATGTISYTGRFNYNPSLNVRLSSYTDNTSLSHTLYLSNSGATVKIATPTKTYTVSGSSSTTLNLTPADVKNIIESESTITYTLTSLQTTSFVGIYCNQGHMYNIVLD